MTSARRLILLVGAPNTACDRRIEPTMRWAIVGLTTLVQPVVWTWIATRLGPGVAERPPAALCVALGCLLLVLVARRNAVSFAERAGRAERLAKLTPLQRVSQG